MPAFAVASDGSKLSAVPRTADPHKRDRIAQAVVIKLPESFRVDKIEEVEDGKVQASLAGSNPVRAARRTSGGREANTS